MRAYKCLIPSLQCEMLMKGHSSFRTSMGLAKTFKTASQYHFSLCPSLLPSLPFHGWWFYKHSLISLMCALPASWGTQPGLHLSPSQVVNRKMQCSSEMSLEVQKVANCHLREIREVTCDISKMRFNGRVAACLSEPVITVWAPTWLVP